MKKQNLTKLSRAPTEKQVKTWENEGGKLNNNQKKTVIINGILCETWSDRFRATFLPVWKNAKNLLKHSK